MKRFTSALIYTVLMCLILAVIGAGLYGFVLACLAIGPWALLTIPFALLFCAVYNDTTEDGYLIV